jgi:hypothetical protein
MAKRRRTGGGGAARNVFAIFWISLAGLSGFYLFTLFTDPTALGGPSVQISTAPSAAPEAREAPGVAPASVAVAAPSVDPAEVTALKNTIRDLNQQLAQLDSRLKPIERFIGPVAALPPSASVSTSPPKPAAPEPAAAAPEPEEEEVVEEAMVEAPPPPAPVATAQPEPEPAPPPAPAAEPKPEPEPASDDVAAPAAIDPDTATEEEEVEIAAFDPVTLPPAANDGSTRYGIEIGSVNNRDDLRPLWREYLTKHAALVAGLQPRRVLAPDKSWRLIAGPFANAQDAEGACSLFKKADRPCAATVYAGDAL